ncbi:MAG: hypothetical protein HYV55_01010 [Parcubacteria group bacterium]|nr:hypothetical protein [Parcubacteria group bacterium]
MKKLHFALLVLFLLLSAAPFTYAAQGQGGLVPCGYDLNGNGTFEASERCQPCDIFSLIKRILDFVLFAIVPAIAVLMVVIGGSYFLFSQGNPANIQRGRDILTSVVGGLIIVYASWLVVNLFFVAIGVQQWTGLGGGFFSIPCAPR